METMTRCIDCSTPVGPDRLRCSRCKSRYIDRILDVRLNAMRRGVTTSRDGIETSDRFLAAARANKRP